MEHHFFPGSSLPLSLSRALSLWDTLCPLSYSLTFTQALSVYVSQTIYLSHTRSLSLASTHPYSLSLTDIHTHSLSLSHSIHSLRLALSPNRMCICQSVQCKRTGPKLFLGVRASSVPPLAASQPHGSPGVCHLCFIGLEPCGRLGTVCPQGQGCQTLGAEARGSAHVDLHVHLQPRLVVHVRLQIH